jgi:hypothetical protein
VLSLYPTERRIRDLTDNLSTVIATFLHVRWRVNGFYAL